MMEAKQQLAYDKGRLESTVEQLRAELQGLASSNQEAIQLRKTNAALEAKCTKVVECPLGGTQSIPLGSFRLNSNCYWSDCPKHLTSNKAFGAKEKNRDLCFSGTTFFPS